MKPFLFSTLLLLTFSLNAQAPTAVPIPKEPHHHLVLENKYVRVFRVSVPAHEATLLHQHDVPYLYVSLGPADVINAVQGKPEVRLVMADGQLGYSPGHFAHIARNESDTPFNNVTIELLKPQGEPRNLCAQVLPGGLASFCNKPPPLDYSTEPEFETAEMRVDLVRLSPNAKHAETATKLALLIVGLDDSGVKAIVKGKSTQILQKGVVAWFDAASNVQFSNESSKTAAFLEITFRDAAAHANP